MSFDPKQEEHDRLKVVVVDQQRRWLNNISFMVELFKLKMLTRHAIMHKCVGKLLMSFDDKSLGCLCDLLSAIGKDLDLDWKVMHRLSR